MILKIMRSKIDTETPTAINKGKYHSRIIIKKEYKKTIWLKKHKFRSLLNLRKSLIDFGLLVEILEGKNQSKGYLR